MRLRFQSTHPLEVRPLLLPQVRNLRGSFNPRTHSRCDVRRWMSWILLMMFQSTHPLEVRLYNMAQSKGFFGFNPRTHSRCDRSSLLTLRLTSLFQSTHPLEVRLFTLDALVHHINVSIHAPTRGATIGAVIPRLGYCVSIHAPTRGATSPPLPVPGRVPVSIHAPTRGATHIADSFNFA